MKKSVALAIFLLFGLGISVQNVELLEVHAADVIGPAEFGQASPNIRLPDYQDSSIALIHLAKDNGKSNGGKAKVGNENKSDKPDLRYVDWSKPDAVKKDEVNGNGNGNGQENEDKDKEDEGDKEDDKGFDRLWDVILYG
jgi:hypothetical protein